MGPYTIKLMGTLEVDIAIANPYFSLKKDAMTPKAGNKQHDLQSPVKNDKTIHEFCFQGARRATHGGGTKKIYICTFI